MSRGPAAQALVTVCSSYRKFKFRCTGNVGHTAQEGDAGGHMSIDMNLSIYFRAVDGDGRGRI